MKGRPRFLPVLQPLVATLLAAAAGALWLSAALGVEPTTAPPPTAPPPAGETAETTAPEPGQVVAARERAKTMHDIYAASLETMHEHYFHGDRAIVPARALEDVFAEIKRQSQTEARWIAVNLRAMSINHEPKTDFEKRAAREIAAGQAAVEAVEAGFYRRAGAIPLSAGCVSCHAGLFKEPTKTPKFAGLVISVPLGEQSGDSPDAGTKRGE
jgi:hypothetical protein